MSNQPINKHHTLRNMHTVSISVLLWLCTDWLDIRMILELLITDKLIKAEWHMYRSVN